MSKINPCIVDLGAAVFDILKNHFMLLAKGKKIWNYFVFI